MGTKGHRENVITHNTIIFRILSRQVQQSQNTHAHILGFCFGSFSRSGTDYIFSLASPLVVRSTLVSSTKNRVHTFTAAINAA